MRFCQVHVNNRKFFAFSHFKNGASQCHKTYPGWHRDAKNPDAKKWGCYTGMKTSQVTRMAFFWLP